MTGPVVIKVGGSLLGWPELPKRLGTFLEQRADARQVLIVGGGPVADIIRAVDRTHALGEEHAHWLAIRGLDLTAHVLAALVPRLEVVETTAQLAGCSARNHHPVLAPRRFLEEDDARPDPLPHRWEVTSDSIGARLAGRLGASELVLLKSAPLPPGADLLAAARLGLVDPLFPEISAGLERVLYVNLREAASACVQVL